MPAPFEYEIVEMTDEELAAESEVLGALTASVRRLGLASLQTTVDHDAIAEVTRQIDALSERLEASRIPGNFGVKLTSNGRVRGFGNAVVGLRNPVAPPVRITQDRENGRASASFELGPLYEGPPGMVHGGVAALVLDQVFGEAAAAGGKPGMTGTLTLRYRRPTPLGPCTAEAWCDRVEGIKTIVKGELRNADGQVTVDAEGVFILPRWAREQIAAAGPPQYE